MKIVRALCALFYFGLFPEFCVSTSSWMESLIRYIREDSSARQVILVSHLADKERFESRIINELFVKIGENFATMKINIKDLEATKSKLPDAEIEMHGLADTAQTVFIILHESREILGLLPSHKMIDIMLDISNAKLQSKFLLVLVTPVLNDGFEDFLQYAWEQLLIDFTLVEFTEVVRQSGKLIGTEPSSFTTPIIHQLNLFNKKYTRENWTLSSKWFPDKVKNMWGHPLRIIVYNVPPFSFAEYNDRLETIHVDGPNIKLLKIIGGMLNFSMDYLPRVDSFMEMYLEKNPTTLFNLMKSGKVDIMAYLSPHLVDDVKYNTLRTAMIRIDQFCPVVPILPTVQMPFPTDFFEAYLVSLTIVALFWILNRGMKFKARTWQPFNILRVLLGVTSTQRPVKVSERFLFACLIFVSAIYSSNIFIALTNISLQTSAEREYDSFEDLLETGLTPIISNYVYNKTFGHADKSLLALKSKTVTVEFTDKCPEIAARYKNVTCIMSKLAAEILVRVINRQRGRQIKIVKPCVWSDSTGFFLSMGSPYRSQINGVLGRIQSSGLLEKLYTDGVINISSSSMNSEEVKKDDGMNTKANMRAFRRQLLAIAIVGYGAAFCTFVAEILLDCTLKYKRGIVKEMPKIEDFNDELSKNRLFDDSREPVIEVARRNTENSITMISRGNF